MIIEIFSWLCIAIGIICMLYPIFIGISTYLDITSTNRKVKKEVKELRRLRESIKDTYHLS